MFLSPVIRWKRRKRALEKGNASAKGNGAPRAQRAPSADQREAERNAGRARASVHALTARKEGIEIKKFLSEEFLAALDAWEIQSAAADLSTALERIGAFLTMQADRGDNFAEVRRVGDGLAGIVDELGAELTRRHYYI